MVVLHLLKFIFKFYKNTSSQDVVGFFSSSISTVPQLFETCCVFEFLKLPPAMKITLIACLWNIQSETEYAVIITNRWKLTFYIPCYSISSFPWLFFFFFFFALKQKYPLKFCGHSSIIPQRATSWSEKRFVSFQTIFSNHWLGTYYVPHTSLDVENTYVNLDWVLPLWYLYSSAGNKINM